MNLSTPIFSRRPPSASHARLSGFSLLSMVIAVLVSGILMVTALQAWQYMEQQNTAANLATGLAAAQNTASAYATKYYSQLVSGQPVCASGTTGCVANPLKPTSAEMAALGVVPGANALSAYTGGTFNLSFSLTPAGCSGPSCNVSWLVYLPSVPTSQGKPALNIVASAAVRSAANAGFSSQANPSSIVGLRGLWSQPNPLGAVPGVLGAAGSFTATQFASYLPRSGTLPMTGNLSMGGNSITGANNVTATGSVTASNVTANSASLTNVTAGNLNSNSATINSLNAGSVSAASGSISTLNSNNLTSANGSITTLNSGAITAGTVSSGGTRLNSQGVSLPALANQGWGCSPNGSITAASDGSGKLMVCQNGTWQPVGGGLSSTYYAFYGNFTQDSGWIYNGTGHVEFITVQGGAQNAVCGNNDWQLTGYTGANGAVVSAGDNNQTGAKSGTIYFFVNPGDSFRATSSPWNCWGGAFSMSALVLQ